MSRTASPPAGKQPPAAKQLPAGDERRNFLEKVGAVVIGGLVMLVPAASGLWTFLNPLRRKGATAEFVRITPLAAVPADGVPRLFQVIRDRTDAWTHYDSEPVGAVYLRNVDGNLFAFNAECPHAGCMVAFLGDQKKFQCPCHDSSFQENGERIDPQHCPSPRGLDPLAVEVRDESGTQDVYVKFENFLAGSSKRIPRA
jgi:Rieske Fe-S protein